MSKKIELDLLDEGGSHYVSERKVYPRDVAGTLNRLRVAAVFWLLGMYYVFPWLQWDGRQAVLFDLPARKFHVWGLTFWPQDFTFLAMLLIILALVLFFAPPCSAACGAAMPARRRCGRKCSCGWSAGPRATERSGCSSTPARGRARRSCARGPSTCCGWCSRCGRASPSSASSPRSWAWARGPGRSPGKAGKSG